MHEILSNPLMFDMMFRVVMVYLFVIACGFVVIGSGKGEKINGRRKNGKKRG
jgi:Ni,Fe-hydrogenase I cytochrome b subunit